MRLPLRSWTSTLSSLGFKWCERKPSRPKRHQRQTARLAVEALESRQLLASDLAALSVSSNGDQITVQYQVAAEMAVPFDIGLYHSADGVSHDGLLATHRISDSNLLALGTHSVSFNPNIADIEQDYGLIISLDSGSELSESEETNNDTLYGGGVFQAGDGTVHVHGTAAADNVDITQPGLLKVKLNGTTYEYTASAVTGVHVRAHGGNDDVQGSTGTQPPIWAYGGAGDDQLYGGAGNDLIEGGDGADQLKGRTGNDILRGGLGNDHLWGDAGNDTLYGGAGNDILEGNENDDYLEGNEDDDVLKGGTGADTIYGNAGNDSLEGNEANDYLDGGIGNDAIDGGYGDDTIYGQDGNDDILGAPGADVVYAGTGNDTVDGGAGSDTVYGGSGNDTISGGTDDDYLYGEKGDDSLTGDAGNDTLVGGPGADILDGVPDGEPSNSAPTTSGIAGVSVNEDAAPAQINLFNAFADIEDDDDQLTYTITGNTNAQLFAAVSVVAATGLLVLDFGYNKNGQAQMTVRATDPLGLYVETTFDVEVAPINDAPTTSGFFDVTIDEDSGTTSVGVAGGFFDIEDDAQLVYTVASNTNPGLFSSTPISGAGVLALNYSADANGEADLTLRATDPGGLYVESTFHVTVTPVNDAPSFQVGPNQSVHMNAGEQTVSGFATAIDPGASNEPSQILSFLLTTNHPSLFSTQPAIAADGTLTYTPVPNATGSAIVTVQLRDDGGTDFGGEFISGPQTFLITVVNEAPVVGQLLDGPDPVIAGSDLRLEASGVSDDGAVQSVVFYHDSNHDNVLSGTDALLGTDSDGSNGWGVAVSTAGFDTGSQRYFAVATDDQGVVSAPATVIGTVGNASVLDNSDPGYVETGSEWSDGSSAGLGGNSRQHGAGTGQNSAAWNFGGLAPGLYEVQVAWSAAADRATNAHYDVSDGSNTLGGATFDQQVAASGFFDGTTWWQTVGAFQTTTGALSVNLSDNANGVVSADAVRLTLVAPLVLYWDADGEAANNAIGSGAGLGGSGGWTAGSGNLWFNPLTGQDVAWVDGAQAVFAGADGTVTITDSVSTAKLTATGSSITLQSGTVDLPAYTGTTVDVASGTLTIASTLAGPGGLTKSGSGTLIVSGQNTFTGGVTIQDNGTLQLGSADALNAANPNEVNFAAGSSGVLRLAGNSVAVSGLSTADATSSAAVENGSGTLATLTVSNAAGTSDMFGGVLRNGTGQDLALTKAGVGTLVLTGANTFTGLTTAAGGILEFGGPTTAPAVSSILVSGGDISIDDGVRLTSRTGNIQFSSDNSIRPTGTSGAIGFTAVNSIYTITVDAGVTGTIAAAITGITTGNSIKRLGVGTLVLSGQNVLVTNVNANLTAGLTVDGGGALDITGLVKAASSLQSNRSNATSTVGQTTSGNALVIDGQGRIIAGRLDVGGSTFGNNSVVIASPGSKTNPSYWMIGNGGQLNLGVSSSGNTVEVSDGAYVFQSNGGGTNAWTIGTNAGATGNSLIVTGAGSTVDRTAAAGSAIVVGAQGNSNSLIVSDGGLVLPRRLIIGNGTVVGNGSYNSVLVTDAGSSIAILSDSNGIFQVGAGVGSSGNNLVVSDGASISLVGANATRAFSIGSANSANDNYVQISGAGSSAVITNLGAPLTIGGLNTGTVVDTTAQANHLDVFGGATLTANHLQLLGVDSAFNLGDGTGVSTAVVGNTTFNTIPAIIELTAASARLNIDGGRLITGVGVPLISGAGIVQLDGAAYISTAGFNTSIASAIVGTGSLTKEAAGTLTLSGSNTYTGQTIVQAGELNVTGALTDSDVTVSGGSLTGNGTLGGSVTIAGGAFLAPGAAATAILSTGDLTLASGARYAAQVNGDSAGTQYDQTNVAGGISLGGAQLVLSGTRAANDGTILVLLANDGTDAVSGTFANLAEGAAVAIGGVVYHITYTYNAETAELGTGNDVALIDSASLSGVGLNLAASVLSENDSVSLSGAFNDPGSTLAHTVTINWGDGSAATVVNLDASVFQFDNVTHQYADNLPESADYTIHVTVEDTGSVTMSVDTQVTVLNVAPSATIAQNGPVQTNQPVTVSLTGSDVSTVDATSLHYFFSTSQSARDGATYATNGTSASQEFSFASGGIHAIYARVLDKDGGLADYQVDVTATAPPQLLYWDANGAAAGLGGSGTWDATSANWSTSALGDVETIGWVSDADAIFEGTAAAVTVTGTLGVRSAQFNTTGYVIQSGSLEASFEGLSITVQSGQSATIDSSITGSAGLTKLGGGTLTLSGNNSYTGGTTIAAGTLTAAGGLAVPGQSAVSLNDSGVTLSLLSNQTIGSLAGMGHVDLGSSILTVGTNGTSTTFAGLISGSGGLAKLGAGTLELTGDNTYSGGTTVSAGTLSIDALSDVAGQASALGHSGTITVFNSTFQYTGTAAASTGRWSTGAVNGTTVIDVTQPAASLTLTGTYTTSQNLTKTSPGTLILGGEDQAGFRSAAVNAGTLALTMKSTNPNSFSAVGAITDVKPGATLQLRKAADGIFYDGQVRATPGDALRQVHMSGGTLDLGGDDVNRIPVVDGTGIVTNSAAGTAAVLTVFLNFNKTFSGTIADGAGTVAVHAGTLGHNGFSTTDVSWTLTGENTYSGGTTIGGNGIVRLGAADALPALTVLQLGVLNQGYGVLDLNGHDLAVSGVLTDQAGGANNVRYDAVTNSAATPATLTVDNAADYLFEGVFAGNLAVDKYGPGKLTVAGSSTNTGDVAVYDGNLKILGTFTVIPYIVEGFGDPQITGADDPYYSVVTVSLAHGEAGWTSIGNPDLHTAPGNPDVLASSWQEATVRALSGTIEVQGGHNSNSPFAFSVSTVMIVTSSTTSGFTTPFAVGTLGDIKSWVQYNSGAGFDLAPNGGTLASWDTKVIVMEDQYGLGFSDNDYDDNYWVVTATESDVPKPTSVCWTCINGVMQEMCSTTPGQASSISPSGVRRFDGGVAVEGGTLYSGGFGTPFGQENYWTNQPLISTGNTGEGMAVSQTPKLLQVTGTTIVAAFGPNAYWFDLVEGDYVPRFSGQATLVHDAGDKEFTLTGTAGTAITFNDFDTSLPMARWGTFKSMADAAGNVTTVTAYTGDGKIAEVQRTGPLGSGTVTESYLYTYNSSGVSAGLQSSVTLRRRIDAGAWETVRKEEFTYYDGEEDFGNARDLKLSVVKDGSNQTIDTTYYRYYTEGEANGYQHGLKYIFRSNSYSRLDEAFANPFEATDEQVAPYADGYMEYDSQQRVTTLISQGDGCSSCTGGLGTYEYEYFTSENEDGHNSWKYKTVETLPDGNQNIVYMNYAGETMLSIFKDTTTDDEWLTFYKYDSAGRQVLMANPSAVTGFSESYADLLNAVSGNYQYLADSAGLMTVTDYYTTTTATTTTAGGAAGYYQDTKLKQGETGTAILQDAVDYIQRTAGSTTIFVAANNIVYRNDDGTGGQTTSFAYTWTTGTTHVESMTVSNPVVSSGQNGPGTADTMTAVFDQYGRTSWTKDGDGFINFTSYDQATSAAVKMIVDVDTTQTSDFTGLPSGWSTPSGGGLHLITLMEVDTLGRGTKITDPNENVTYVVYNDTNHETRTYRGWNSGTNTTTGPTIVTRDDRPGSYYETLTMSAAPAVSSGRPTGAEAISGLQTLSRSYTNSAGQLVKTDDYFDFTGLTYSTAANIGTEGTNFYRTEYAYQQRGWNNRLEDPTGTITRTVHDSLGRAVSQWVGTDDVPTSGTWSPTNNTGANMVQTAAYVYDGGGIGDSNLTQSSAIAGVSTSYATNYQYDFRNRLTDARGADGVATKYTLDNLGEATTTQTYADADTDFTIDTAELRGKMESLFDDQGRLYRTTTYQVDQSSGTIGNSLTSNAWFDKRGQVVKTADANGLFSKTLYDGVGRATDSVTSYQSSETSWSDALTLSSDTVIEQSHIYHDKAGRAVAALSFQRYGDDTTTTGALTGANSYRSAAVTWYDKADRPLGSADFGRDNGSTLYVFTSTGTVLDSNTNGIPDEADGSARLPNTSDNYLASKTEYDDAGRAYRQTDNLGHVTQTNFDALGRTKAVIANYVNGTASETETETDQTVNYIYDTAGRLSKHRALNPKGSGNGVENQDTTYLYESVIDASWATSTISADSSDTTSSGTDQVKVTYDRLGREATMTDQRGVVHEYTYDSAGRLQKDAVTSLGGSGTVDGAVRRIERAYDDVGRLFTLTSYDAATGGNVVNQVKWAYNGYGLVSQVWQNHSGAVDGSTLSISYTYEDGAASSVAKYVRLSKVTYPDGSEVFYNYPSSGVGAALSRLDNIADDASGTTKYVQYAYLGVRTIVTETHPGVSGGLTLSYDAAADHTFSGWDKFGRIVDQLWTNGAGTTTRDEYTYTYDRNSNRLTRANTQNTALSESYTYDGLDRLIDTDRNGSAFESWTLDTLGNWSSFTDGGTTTTRSADAVNQITSISGSGAVTSEYDAAGNMVVAPQPADGTKKFYLTYDAWNRLVKVEKDAVPSGRDTVATYEYDGRNYRIQKTVGSDTFDYYYNESWQLLEARLNGDADPQEQYVWVLSYIDAPVLRFYDADVNPGTTNATEYYTHDATFNTTAKVAAGTGSVVSYYAYDTYGQVTFYDATWTTRSESAGDNDALFAGYRFDTETDYSVARNRYYDAALGVWGRRDPIAADINSYRYAGNGPTNATDPDGKEIVRIVRARQVQHLGTEEIDEYVYLPPNQIYTVPSAEWRLDPSPWIPNDIQTAIKACGGRAECEKLLAPLLNRVKDTAMPSGHDKCRKWVDTFISAYPREKEIKLGNEIILMPQTGSANPALTEDPLFGPPVIVTRRGYFGQIAAGFADHWWVKVKFVQTGTELHFDIGSRSDLGDFGGADRWFDGNTNEDFHLKIPHLGVGSYIRPE